MKPILQRALLATLPVLGLGLGTRDGLLHAAVSAGTLLVAGGIFLAIRGFLPRAVHRLSFFLMLLALAVVFEEISPVSFLVVVSSVLLVPAEIFQNGVRGRKISITTGLACLWFVFFVAGHGLLTELLRDRAGVGLFGIPAGSYLLLGFVLACSSGRRGR